MAKKRHMDFMILDDSDEKIKFRFYPRRSSMHSFDENPPKRFEDVFKVYYAWSILRSYDTWNSKGEDIMSAFEEIISFPCDECSALTSLGDAIRQILKDKEPIKLYSFGQPASEWEIEYHVWYDLKCRYPLDDEKIYNPDNDTIKFVVFNNWNNKGYKFILFRRDAEKFADFLDEVNQHMLENGVPI